jgi:hypothetical protein
MKMVKSLLLGSAAGLVAMSGAQAADLPVKAKPVEYVKICSLYGAGFFYIPGTDICLKIGGYVRFQENIHTGASISGGAFFGTGGRNTRLDAVDYAHRVRTITTFDTRQQTAYGTLRTYVLMGFTHDSTGGAAVSLYATRAFIQFAGFTFGKATSFFDFASTAAAAYNAGFLFNSDTGDSGHIVAAYTAQLGNGLSATLSFEQSRRESTVFLNGGTPYSWAARPDPPPNNLGAHNLLQDVVGNIRIDQAWGSAQVSAAAHNISAGYYGATENLGHPCDVGGGAASAGLRINTPWIAAGNYFQGQVIYAEGATGYLAQFPRGATWNRWSGDNVGFGFWDDAVFSSPFLLTNGEIERTTGWSAFASYEHFWAPNWRTSLYGTYIDISYNGNARAAICDQGFFAAGANNAFQGLNCNPSWSAWAIGSRTQWDIVKGLYVGLDVIYQRLHTADPGTPDGRVFITGSGAKTPNVFYRVEDQESWVATWRIHRDIVP